MSWFLLAQSLEGQSPTPVAFEPWITDLGSLQDHGFVFADFNSDSRMDFLLHGRTIGLQSTSLVLTNRTDGFGRMASLPGSNSSFAAGDWNNDGHMDLLRWASGTSTSGIMVQTNGGFRDYFELNPGPTAIRTGSIMTQTGIWMPLRLVGLFRRRNLPSGNRQERAFPRGSGPISMPGNSSPGISIPMDARTGSCVHTIPLIALSSASTLERAIGSKRRSRFPWALTPPELPSMWIMMAGRTFS